MKYFRLLRVDNWIKNILVFTPLIFSNSMNNSNVLNSILGFLSFSMLCSSVYVINDLRDIEKDRVHPRKKFRPLASGKISKRIAIVIAN